MAAPPRPRVLDASDHSVLMVFDDAITPAATAGVHRLTHALLEQRLAWVRNVHPAYGSVLVSYDPGAVAPDEVHRVLGTLVAALPEMSVPAPRRTELPVCYDPDFGLDLDDVAAQTGLRTADVVRLHTAPEYHVQFLGFSPGFPYLAGLAPELRLPRRPSPRTWVPAGSVAIAGVQTGVYPIASPGGWWILGRTPVPLFAPDRMPPARLRMGDRLRFRAVARDEFEDLAATRVRWED